MRVRRDDFIGTYLCSDCAARGRKTRVRVYGWLGEVVQCSPCLRKVWVEEQASIEPDIEYEAAGAEASEAE